MKRLVDKVSNEDGSVDYRIKDESITLSQLFEAIYNYEEELVSREVGCDYCNAPPAPWNCTFAMSCDDDDCFGDYASKCPDYKRDNYCPSCGRKLVD